MLTFSALSTGTSRLGELVLSGGLFAGCMHVSTGRCQVDMSIRTALKRRLLSARASSLLGAYTGAVVTSAADHFECVE